VPLTGEYEPSALAWVREQVETYEATGGREANTQSATGIPVVVITCLGAASGKIRKFVLMRVEHDGEYALVASMAGAPNNPDWYHNLVTEPLVMIQDGPRPQDFVTRIAEGDERQLWWDRSVAVFPTYAEYQSKTDRIIPVFLATPTAR
jgi:deazaflavin-dependent oxidoreductase (nitroreductase family)